MKIEFAATWVLAEQLITANFEYIGKVVKRNNVQTHEFTSVSVGENPYDMTCKWRGTKYNKIDTLITKIRDAYPDLTQSDIKGILMTVGVKQIRADKNSKVVVRTFESPQAFVRSELNYFHPVECSTDMWDCDGSIPEMYNPYLSGLKRPWSLDHIKGAMIQELDKYNRNLPKDHAHAKISKDTFDVGFDMAISEYYNAFDDQIRKNVAYDGTDPKKTIGMLIDALAITGDRDLQIAKVWQYLINVKRVLYPECGIKRRWHVCPMVVGKGGTGKTETLIHFLVKPLMGRGTASRFSELADSRWTRAFSKYYVALMDDIGYDDFTDAKAGVIKQMITADKKLDRSLGGNRDSDFNNIHLRISLCASSNFHIADLTQDEALLRRIVELPSAKRGRKDMTPVFHIDPYIIYRSIDEGNLDIDPLVDDPHVNDLWIQDTAEIRQKHWLYRGLRQLKYLPQTITSTYVLDNTREFDINELNAALTAYHRSEYGISPRNRTNIEAKLEEIGIYCYINSDGRKMVKLLDPFGGSGSTTSSAAIPNVTTIHGWSKSVISENIL